MIGLGTGVRVYLACGQTDMRKGIGGLAALTQEVLRHNPASGAVFAFRGRRGDRIKLLTWDGQGFCLYYKVLEKGRFPWPSPADGTARLTAAQMAMLWEGIDWRRPAWSAPPARVV
ncbi:IS66 family insertion sequence element accessory protein TnpB [Chelativorans xinjiangense]|uniref:IS66 family insertion sequence element accessory protein TnpB n=1 Tax=Chelativorans xinjiangense TaxID=2681485 RepID=UPI00135B0335|nr:IS66 family insertion sequence element accessory protein TnpB [Chelativorans xinjiangense]